MSSTNDPFPEDPFPGDPFTEDPFTRATRDYHRGLSSADFEILRAYTGRGFGKTLSEDPQWMSLDNEETRWDRFCIRTAVRLETRADDWLGGGPVRRAGARVLYLVGNLFDGYPLRACLRDFVRPPYGGI